MSKELDQAVRKSNWEQAKIVYAEEIEQLINKAVIEELQDALSLWSSGETKEHMLNRIKALKKQIGEE